MTLACARLATNGHDDKKVGFVRSWLAGNTIAKFSISAVRSSSGCN